MTTFKNLNLFNFNMHEKLYNLLLRRTVIIPTGEIYNPVAGFYDYGPIGTLIKRKIVDLWREIFLKEDGFFEIDGSTILQEDILRASGHVDHFNDPMVECKSCKKRFRADHLVEDVKKIDASRMSKEELEEQLKDVKCPACGGELGPVKMFNLMFKLEIGSTGGKTAYLRPETAQNIFTDFLKIFKVHGSKLPFGIGQVGRAYRNEIAPRQALVRVREFEQMELEYFFDPRADDSYMLEGVKDVVVPLQTRKMQREGDKDFDMVSLGDAYENGDIPIKTMAYFMAKEQELLHALGIANFRFRHLMEEETPHYSGGNYDVEIPTKFGWIEVISLAYRTNYDLMKHQESSGKSMEVVADDGQKIVPHVVEPSIGLGRLFWSTLEHAYRHDPERGWDWLDLPPRVAPFDVYVLPLMKKEPLMEKAKEVRKLLLAFYDVYMDKTGSIGKRYARADEIGVPYCVTVDFQTLEDNTVTVRFRNDGKQVRIALDQLCSKLGHWKYNGIVKGSESGLDVIN